MQEPSESEKEEMHLKLLGQEGKPGWLEKYKELVSSWDDKRTTYSYLHSLIYIITSESIVSFDNIAKFQRALSLAETFQRIPLRVLTT